MPFVSSWSHFARASVPKDAWPQAWFGLQSYEGFLQPIPGFLRLRVAARELTNGDIRLVVETNWEHREQIDEWLNTPWTAVLLLEELQDQAYDIEEEVFEDLS